MVLGAALCAAIASFSARAEFATPYGVAVIIGNKSYENERVPEVTYAHRDADAFRRFVLDVLGFNPDNVIDLRDSSQAKMEAVFGNERSHQGRVWRFLNPRHGSDVVVFYSGHGVPGLKDGRGYLLPADADPDSAEINGYPIDLLYTNLGKLEEANSVQVFLDACFSGDSDRGMLVRSASPVFVQAALPEASGDNLTVLAAASSKEVASWDDEAEQGLFTHHLMDALYGAGDADGDGSVTAVEAKAYLDDTMTLAARREFGRLQNASLNGLATAVLASSGADGAFPPRPSLDGHEVTVIAAADEEVATASEESPEGMEDESPEELEKALGLSRAKRVLVQRGLAALDFDVGPADGAFGPRTRAAIADYQRAKGWAETRYLSAEQAEALVALGEEAAQALAGQERRADDEAFARAKGLDTVAAYEEYLRTRPNGVHEAEARRLRDEASQVKRVGEVFRDCLECPEMVVVPAGSYRMGSPSREEDRDDDEGPVHEVRIAEPFAVGVYEVTFSEWEACVNGGGCGGHRPDDRGWGRGNRPVINVSWEDAQRYVTWLTRRTGEAYRLLSESEWEYAARAGTTTPFHFGATISTDQANYDGNYTYGSGREGRYREKTAPVGRFPANRFGLHDVHGNVWEWVQDCWNASYHGAPRNGSAWERGDCSKRVLRGGSWNLKPRILRSANRYWFSSGNRNIYLGFRIARTLTP